MSDKQKPQTLSEAADDLHEAVRQVGSEIKRTAPVKQIYQFGEWLLSRLARML